jgi:spore maturation protein SpmA
VALNLLWAAFFIAAFATACVRLLEGDTEIFARMLTALFDAGRSGFELALALTGVMALWLGILRIGERAGLVAALARLGSPVLRGIFPGVPQGHPAQGAMTMNVSANLLGLDNAATPLGLEAMRELQTLNSEPERATDAQIMFMVLNTAGFTLVPTSVIALRQAIALRQGLTDFNAADIFLPTLLATAVSCISGLLAVAVCQRLPIWRAKTLLPLAAVLAAGAALLTLVAQLPQDRVSEMAGLAGGIFITGLVTAFIAAGVFRRVPVYETFVEGAREGFGVAVHIIPYLVGMLAAIAVFRAAGCMDAVMHAIGSVVASLGLDPGFLPALPVGLMKILSGSAARGLMVDVMQTQGVGSYAGKLAAIMQGSTETTLYVLAVYSGSVGLRNTRHALGCALFADLAGILAAIAIGSVFFR